MLTFPCSYCAINCLYAFMLSNSTIAKQFLLSICLYLLRFKRRRYWGNDYEFFLITAGNGWLIVFTSSRKEEM